ncbi:galactose oxidase-like domain-containing protein, partial [Nocardia salmonicida]|uniref:galactose oxidase-like domain-containing protein n=1 Tax=Nocardia salmonicida TaxID=53431 RepID=UPI00365FBF2E
MALVPSGDDGEVLLLGGSEHWVDQEEPDGDFKKTRVYDVRSHALVDATIDSPDSDVFCSGHAFTRDGRLLIVGGTKAYSSGHGHDLAFWGHRRCWLYSPRDREWHEATQLLPDPYGEDSSGGGRWYPGAVTMGSGEVLALFGHVAQDDTRHRNATPERYNVNANVWLSMPKRLANDANNYAPHFPEPPDFEIPKVRFLFFARTFQLPDGRLFFATPMPTRWEANTSDLVDPTDGSHFSSFYDPSTGNYTGPDISEPVGYDGWSFPCVLLPLLPGDKYQPRVLHCGRAQALRVDLGASAPTWESVTTVGNIDRINSCAVLLPTGQVCLVGGVENQGNDGDQVLPAEIYDPGINWADDQYEAGLGRWTSETDMPTFSRNYHSAALLLPNGSVLTCGGNKDAQADDPDEVGIKQIELFEPAYPAGPRLVISDVPLTVTYGETFDVTVSEPADVERVALIRNGSCTHAYDFDQRYVGAVFTHNPGDDHVRITAPPNGNVAPPGYYMLWIVDAADRPCQVAKFIRVAYQSCTVVTDRSTFSREEVQAKSRGGVATFDNALYVQFDGFIHTELTGAPSFDVHWADTGDMVNSTQVTLVPGLRLQEVDPGSPDVPQRITFPFHVRFFGLDAHATERKLRVTFTLGHHSCSQTLDLTHAPNPYMIDIDPDVNNPAWLSTDVRVFSVEAGQSKFDAVVQDPDNPVEFVRQCLDELNDPANDGNSLFEGLSTDATLDLASHVHHAGLPLPWPVFNYAIARVRYRAAMSTAAQVKCFFRMFNVAATGLEFDAETYNSTPVGPGTVPLLGVVGGEVASIPFFASERVETVQGQPGAKAMTEQMLDSTYEMRTMDPDLSGNEVTAFFGCWLDVNQPRLRFPIAPTGDGPWPEASCRSIQELIRSEHMCIVAEVFYEGDLTNPGETPHSSDNLSQRNLAILHSDNPGASDSHTVMHTFEIKPSLIPALPTRNTPSALSAHLPRDTYDFRLDQLIFRWHNLPQDSEVTVYFSDIDTAHIQTLAVLRNSPLACEVIDKHTLKFKVAGLTWIPIPGGRTLNIPALLSITLPDNVSYGQVYRVSIHQVSGRNSSI